MNENPKVSPLKAATSISDRTSNVTGNPVALVVMGMHRSGTSALTRILSLCGYALPKTLMEPASDNESGFWESRLLVDLNDNILRATDTNWNDPFAFDSKLRSMGLFNKFKDEALTALREEFPDSQPIVMKDPRISLLYPFWKNTLIEAGFEPRPIICVRNPVDVASSLSKRNKLPLNRSHLIWLSYQLSAEANTRGDRRAFVSFEDLLANWRASLDHLEQELNFRLERRDPRSAVAIDQFIDPGAVHHSSNLLDTNAAALESLRVSEAYQWFKAAADGEAMDAGHLDNITERYDDIREVFGPIIADAEMNLETLRLKNEADSKSFKERFRETSKKYEDVISNLEREKLSQKETYDLQLSTLQNSRHADRMKLQAEINGLTESLKNTSAEYEKVIANLEDAVTEQSAHARKLINENDDLVARYDSELNKLNLALESRQEIVAALEGELVELNQHLEAALAEHQDKDQVLAEKSDTVAKSEAAIIELKKMLELRERNERALTEKNGLLLSQVAEIESVLEAETKHLNYKLDVQIEAKQELESKLQETAATFQSLITDLEDKLARQSSRYDDLSSEHETTRTEHQSRLQFLNKQAQKAQLKFTQAINEANSEIDGLSRQLDHLSSQKTSLEGNIATNMAELDAVRLELSSVSQQYHAIMNSTVWKATSPLRKLGSFAPWHARSDLEMSITDKLEQDNLPAVPVEHALPLAEATISAPNTENETEAASPSATALPNSVTDVLRQLYGDDLRSNFWDEHTRKFSPSFDSETGVKQKVLLSDDAANRLIDACKIAGKHLNTEQNPDVSIILPVYNQLSFTISAIAAVYTQQTKFTYEIILADDCSTDQTRLIEQGTLPCVRPVRHSKNLGFLNNCNEACKEARGRVIVLLNNDTVVLPGWLDEIVSPIIADSNIGLVGSKLLFPDGVLQEAGGIIWQDGSAWNYGRGQHPLDPKYSYAREVDYCSGASIAISKDLWEELGGFDDETYDTAYYEDADLAIAVREAGKKVLFQPRSMLVHYEGVSSGVDTSQGIKKFQVTNSKSFYEKWKNELLQHRSSAMSPELECERKVKRRMLVIDAVTPRPDQDAGSVVILGMLRALRDSGWRVSFVPEDNFAYLDNASPLLQREGFEFLHFPFYRSVEEILDQRGSEFDAIFVSRVPVAAKHLELIEEKAPNAKIIFNTVDLHYLREQREAELTGDESILARSQQTKLAEMDIINRTDLTIVHSTYEEDVLLIEAPSANVYVFPWVTDTRTDVPDLQHRRSVLFVGSYAHPPNVDAANWLINDIWPIVRASAPTATLRIIGSNVPDEIAQHDGKHGVSVPGWIENLDAEYDIARVNVAPLRFGAGIKGKVISAMRAGVPSVCSGIASEGTGLRDKRDIIVANEPASIANAIIGLLGDDQTWLDLSENGKKFVQLNFSEERAIEHMRSITALLGLSDLETR